LTGADSVPSATGVRRGRAWSWLRARPALVAALVYAVLALLLVAPGLAPGRAFSSSDQLYSLVPWKHLRPDDVRPGPLGGANFELQDGVFYFQPFLRYTRDQLPKLPLWNPFILGGFPFVADAQSAVFSPFSVPSYLLPFWSSLALAAALKLFAAAFGTHLLGRALGMRFGGALLAGVVYAFGLFMVVWLTTALASVWVLIPWLLVMSEHVVRRPGPLPVAGLSIAIALQFFGGHPESSFHALFATLAFVVLRLVQRRRAGGVIAMPLFAWCVALLAGTALAAVMLLPFLEALSESRQTAQRLLEPESPRFLFGLFLADYWGRPTQLLLDNPLTGFSYNHVFYAGALTLMLAPAALFARPQAERIAVAAFAVFALAMVVGIEPVFSLVSGLPVFDLAKNGRMIVLLLLCLALLAGWALDDLSGPPLSRRRTRMIVGAGFAIFFFPFAAMLVTGRISLEHLGDAARIAWLFEDRQDLGLPPAQVAGPIRLAALLEWLAVGGVALVLLVLRSGTRLAPRAFVVLAVALVAADLFNVGMGQNPAIPRENATAPVTPAMRELLAQRLNRFAGLSLALPSNVGMDYGLYDARGYDYPVERRVDTFWRTNINGLIGDLPPVFANGDARSRHALGLLSVTRILQPPEEDPITDARVVYDGPDARVYANDFALPRVILVDRQRTVAGEQAALRAVSDIGFNGREVAITERAVPGVRQDDGGRAGGTGAARLVSYEPERAVAITSADRTGLLVLTDVYYPGWKASVDGRGVPLERVNYFLRGVAVPPGAHRVEMRYEPASFRAGWIISLTSALALVAAVVLGTRRRGRSRST
jgi:hypothetical protein